MPCGAARPRLDVLGFRRSVVEGAVAEPGLGVMIKSEGALRLVIPAHGRRLHDRGRGPTRKGW
jgi:hypothetical protein